jgi:hypothetical protein
VLLPGFNLVSRAFVHSDVASSKNHARVVEVSGTKIGIRLRVSDEQHCRPLRMINRVSLKRI